MQLKNKVSSILIGLKNIISKSVKWILGLPKAIFDAKFSHNTGTKLLSIAMAILFWFFVMDQVDPEITRVIESVPVQLTNTQELDQNNLKIMNQTDFLVNVEVTGRRNNVLSLNSKNIYLWSDMRSVRSGVNNVFINSTINSESVSIKSVLPNEIVLTVDRVVSLPKPVQIIISDKFQDTLYEEALEINPVEIKVSGPESLVNSVSYLGGTISVNALTNDHSREVSLVPYSFDGEVVNGVSLDINYANINLVVGKTKQVSIEPVIIGEPAQGYKIVSIKVNPETVTVKGEVDLVNSLDTLKVETLQLNGDENASLIVEKGLVLPDGIKTVGLNNPIQVELTIEEIQTKEFTYSIAEIPVVNLNENYTTDLTTNPGNVIVRVTDIESIIKNLSKEDIHLDLNFSNVVDIGNYRLKINYSSEKEFNTIVIDPEYVDVNVSDIITTP
ncbi:CdaR family protein [Fusibacter bizertensis]|jgi:Uncharacterized protein conserved in bacteria|uniref:CdaR family protein n=1 Tax=Fusibacter bizertensis TaxID=1488331 RepID=A0ABT6NHF3_9FIRM|nr:CdaR family protein [Fusibacter bizertensis]MDH8679854.1 CdaR family protein [Fusibacter bizertensis]